LTFDPQVEAMQDAAITGDTLLESFRAGPLIRVVRIVVDIVRGVQLVDGGPVCPVPDFIELPADEHLVFFGAHRTPSPVLKMERQRSAQVVYSSQ
jgi:hypothetical protein